MIQLLTAASGGQLMTAGIVVFSAASVMFLFELIVAVLSLAAAAEFARVPSELDNLSVVALLIMFGAIYVFIIGIGRAGWIRSRIAGIITTIFAVVSTCLITYVIYSVLALFM